MELYYASKKYLCKLVCCAHLQPKDITVSMSCCEGGSNEWGMKLRFSKLFNLLNAAQKTPEEFVDTQQPQIILFIAFSFLELLICK